MISCILPFSFFFFLCCPLIEIANHWTCARMCACACVIFRLYFYFIFFCKWSFRVHLYSLSFFFFFFFFCNTVRGCSNLAFSHQYLIFLIFFWAKMLNRRTRRRIWIVRLTPCVTSSVCRQCWMPMICSLASLMRRLSWRKHTTCAHLGTHSNTLKHIQTHATQTTHTHTFTLPNSPQRFLELSMSEIQALTLK